MRLADAALALYALTCLAALTWPGLAHLGGAAEPLVLGLPRSLAWHVGWVALSFVALALYHRATRGEDEDP